MSRQLVLLMSRTCLITDNCMIFLLKSLVLIWVQDIPPPFLVLPLFGLLCPCVYNFGCISIL